MDNNKVNVINRDTVTIEKEENGSKVVLTTFDYYLVVASMQRYSTKEPLVLYVGKYTDESHLRNRFNEMLFYLLREPANSSYFGEPNVNYHFKNGYKLSDSEKDRVRECIVKIVDTCRGKYCTFQGHKFFMNEDGLYTCLDSFKLDLDKAQEAAEEMGRFTLCTYVRGGIECPFGIALDNRGLKAIKKFENTYPVFNIRTYKL